MDDGAGGEATNTSPKEASRPRCEAPAGAGRRVCPTAGRLSYCTQCGARGHTERRNRPSPSSGPPFPFQGRMRNGATPPWGGGVGRSEHGRLSGTGLYFLLSSVR